VPGRYGTTRRRTSTSPLGRLARLNRQHDAEVALGTDEPDLVFVLSTPAVAAVRRTIE
jgi:hypothetical protein